MTDHRIADPGLADGGMDKIEWALQFMPVLQHFGEEHLSTKPLAGMRIAACLHLEAKTACLLATLRRLGADVSAAGSNPLSTQDDVCAALVRLGVHVFSRRGMSDVEYSENLGHVLDMGPHIVIDDGADMIAMIHSSRRDLLPGIRGGAEETTTGITRLRAMEKEGTLAFPVIAVNNAESKFLFDNRYGTGQSVMDGLMRTTNALVAGKNVVVAGYGWCGRGVAMRAAGMGARVIVVEVDPHRAFEAVMDGHAVMSMAEAAPLGDIFLTLTGNTGVLRKEHFSAMKDGAILGNAGHFDVEISRPDMESLASQVRKTRPNITTFVMEGGRRIHLLAEGRLVNLAAADGHPIEIMDLSFSIQLLSALHVAEHRLEAGLHDVPAEIDRAVVARKLLTMGIRLEGLTPEQEGYMKSWRE